MIFASLFRGYEVYDAYALKVADERAAEACNQAKVGMLFIDFLKNLKVDGDYLHTEYTDKKAHYFLFTYGFSQKIAACRVFIEDGRITDTKLELTADISINHFPHTP